MQQRQEVALVVGRAARVEAPVAIVGSNGGEVHCSERPGACTS